MIPGYANIYNLGNPALVDLFKGPVNIEEKVDGSQISFWVNWQTGELEIRSKGAQLNLDAPDSMFALAVERIKAVQDKLTPGLVYRGEYLRKPKHNALAYGRVPTNNIIIFDIETLTENRFLTPSLKETEAERIGFEAVPNLSYMCSIDNVEALKAFMETDSILGGQKVEGIVIKPFYYDVIGRDGKLVMGKLVSEAFKETHAREWKISNPRQGDIIQRLADELTTEARWRKAVQHLREQGLIEDDPKDIGKLMKEVPEDVEREEKERIMQVLYTWAWPQLRRMCVKGMPDWYKQQLIEAQFEGSDENSNE